jgi:hypothetical protein
MIEWEIKLDNGMNPKDNKKPKVIAYHTLVSLFS